MERSTEKVSVEKVAEVGVIVGRFQVDELTDGHKDLFKKVIAAGHKRVICILGLSPCKSTKRNPLDFAARKQMINESFPGVEVYYVPDTSSNLVWSNKLDEMIATRVKAASVCMYGSRDSFLAQYCGMYPCEELEPDHYTSGTARRKEISKTANKNQDFRQGVIWATEHQWPASIPTVDIAIFNRDVTKILLGRKPDEDRFRLIGGFVDPAETWEDTAIRETKEEANVTIKHLSYIRSFKIDDWRYTSEVNKITTSLFAAYDWSGTPEPNDDIKELRWFPFNAHILDSVVNEHREMVSYLLENK